MTLTILPRPALARTRHWPYGLLGTLQFLDVATTAWILHTFEGAAEANPITAAIFTGAGLKAGLALLLVLKLAVVVVFYDCQTKVGLASTLYSLVSFNNLLFAALYLFAR